MPEMAGAAIEVPLSLVWPACTVPPVSTYWGRAHAVLSMLTMSVPGATRFGSIRPSPAGPRDDDARRPRMSSPSPSFGRKFSELPTTKAFFTAFVHVFAPGPLFPDEKTTTSGVTSGVSGSASRTPRSKVRSPAP